jgi:hypothetical protein
MLGSVLCHCDQIPVKKASYLLMFSEVSVHHGREVMVEQLTSLYPENREKGIQERSRAT